MDGRLVHNSGICVFENALPGDLCDASMEAFDAGATHVVDSYDASGSKDQRSGKVFPVTTQTAPQLLKRFSDVVMPIIAEYGELVPAFKGFLAQWSREKALYLSTPRIERIDIGGGFNWHVDTGPRTQERCLAAVGYLNDVAEGGETEFAYQDVKVKPSRGRLALFPPYWSHLHRGGAPVSNAKFTFVTFLSMKRLETKPVVQANTPAISAPARPTLAGILGPCAPLSKQPPASIFAPNSQGKS